MRKALQSVGRVAMKHIGADEVWLSVALVLLAIGFWSAWRPGSFLVPGAVLLWIALPKRRAFIEREPLDRKPLRRSG